MKEANTYDIVIAGAGCAGLSLAWYLSQDSSFKQSVLLIDRERKEKNDRSWSFWTKDKIPFESIVSGRWSSLSIADRELGRAQKLDPYEYCTIRSSDFYALIMNRLDEDERFHFHYEEIESINKIENRFEVTTNSQSITTAQVFDSRLEESDLKGINNSIGVSQHFLGWFIKTEKPAFDPETINLFDFRTENQSPFQFFYVLPFSETEALIEYTLFSKEHLSEAQYEMALSEYVNEVLQVSNYTITEKEAGAIPMTAYAFNKKTVKGLYKIGTASGSVKASSGYAFVNIQRNTKEIAKAIIDGVTPSANNERSIFALFDKMLLTVLESGTDDGYDIFSQLLKNNDIQNIFRFLDEESSPIEILKIMNSVPRMRMIHSYFEMITRSPKAN